MASVSVSHSILFIASLLAAVGVSGALIQSVDVMGAAVDDRSVDVSQDIRTDIEIISDPAGPVYNRSGDENVTLLVKNTGSTALPTDPTLVDVIVDGEYQPQVSITVIGDAAWRPDRVTRLEVPAPSLPAGDHRITVTVNAEMEVFEFRT